MPVALAAQAIGRLAGQPRRLLQANRQCRLQGCRPQGCRLQGCLLQGCRQSVNRLWGLPLCRHGWVERQRNRHNRLPNRKPLLRCRHGWVGLRLRALSHKDL